MDDKLQIVLDIIDAKITKWDTTSQGAWSDDKRRLCTKIARELREIKAEVIATFPAPQPSASAFETAFEWRKDHPDGKNWYPKVTK